MLRMQNDMIFFNIPLISSKNQMFHFTGENWWLIVASLASIQFSKNTGFDKGKLSVVAFLNNLLATSNRSISQ